MRAVNSAEDRMANALVPAWDTTLRTSTARVDG